MSKLAIATVVYNNYDVLTDFFRSLANQHNQNFHLFIADLSSKPQKISTSIPHSIIPAENLGYAHGINICIQQARSENYSQFCVINDDVYFESDFVDKVIQSITSHPNAIIGGKIYYAPGFEYHKDRYSAEDKGKVLWFAGGKTDWRHVLTHHRGVDEVDHGQYNNIEETGFVTGCLMCYDLSVVKTVGNWDISYFLYFEDSDYCERAKRAGLKLYYDPTLVIWHKNSQSTEGSGSDIHVKYQTKNRLKFGLKYAPLRTRLHLLKNHFLG